MSDFAWTLVLFYKGDVVFWLVFEAILIANSYTRGSSKSNICVLHTSKSNHKHSISMVMTPPTVNKVIIIAHRLQLFFKMQIVNMHQVNFGTIERLTIWRTRMCLETGYSTHHELNKSQKVLIFRLKWTKTCALPLTLACTIYLCAISNQILVQQLL